MKLEMPLGLALSGGGALGAWQAGCLCALAAGGLRFEKALGFSVGSLTGAGYMLGRLEELMQRWRRVDSERLLRLRPRLKPFSLFSGDPILNAVRYDGGSLRYGGDEERAKRQARCELTVTALRLDDLETAYFRFTPGGSKGWDGPLDERLAASCAIPWIYPPVRIAEGGAVRAYADGGIPGRAWMNFDALSGCRDLVVLEMVRPEEIGVRRWLPWAVLDQRGRETCREQMDRGIESARRWPEAPRVFRLAPSKVLGFSMLAFQSRHCVPALELGLRDGEHFLRDPGRFLAGSPGDSH